MHILVSSHYALPHKGGVEVVVDKFSQNWTQAGHKVTHLTSSIGQNTDINIERSWEQIHLPAINTLEKYAIPYPIFNPVQVRRQVKHLLPQVDIVNIQGILYFNNIITAYMAHSAGIPVVLTEFPGFVQYDSKIVNLIEQIAFETVGRFSAHQADAFVYHNQAVADSLKHYFRPNTIIEQVKVGVDTSHFCPVSPEHREKLREKWNFDKPTVLFVGRLVYRKGIHRLTEMVTDEFELVICGRGDGTIENSNIRVLGFVNDEDLLELYRAADIFILLTDGNDFPLVGLEAMSCGLPVVLFDIPANHEYHSEETAVFVEESIDGILRGIQILVEDEEYRQQMADDARKTALANYDWSAKAQAYLGIFSGLLNDDRT